MLLFLTGIAAAQTPWVLTFSDEFDGRELDLKKWIPHDLANNKPSVGDAAEVSGGLLHLAAKPGFVTTYSKFAQTYGRFEIVCRVTGASNSRVSFRLLPLPAGEIPSIEFSYSNGKYTFENHWGTAQTQRSYGDTLPGPDLSTGFHTIAIEWDTDHIAWFVDGKQRLQSVDGIPQQPLYLTLEADGDSASSFEVDSLLVYQGSQKIATKREVADEIRREVEENFGAAQQIVARDFTLTDTDVWLYIKTADSQWLQGCTFRPTSHPVCSWHLFGQAPLPGIQKSIFGKPYKVK